MEMDFYISKNASNIMHIEMQTDKLSVNACSSLRTQRNYVFTKTMTMQSVFIMQVPCAKSETSRWNCKLRITNL